MRLQAEEGLVAVTRPTAIFNSQFPIFNSQFSIFNLHPLPPRLTPLLLLLAACASAAAAGPERYLGPTALVASKDGRTLYVAQTDAGRIARVDLASGKPAGSIDVPGKPGGLALAPDGSKLYVTCPAPRSTIAVIDLASGRLTARIPVGHTATGPAVTPDGKRLWVCNRFDDDCSVIDLATGETLARVPAVREPVAAAVTPDGRFVVVANHLPADPADSFYVTAVATLIDTRTHQPSSIRLPNGSTGVRGVCISPDGKYACLTHTLGNYELVPSQVVGGWTNMNVLSLADLEAKQFVGSILLDQLHLGAANPWGVAYSPDGRQICVTHAGTHELSVIDAVGLFRDLEAGVDVASRSGATPHSPGVPDRLRRRIRLPGKGPRGVAVAGGKAYVAEYFTDTLAVVDLQPGAELGIEPQRAARPTTIPLGPKPRWSETRRGEFLFEDATRCFEHWQSCASCHPDARTDALNWDLQNDGVGNPKNTKSMLLAHRTPPAMVTGVRASAEVAVRSGFEHILFTEVPEEEAAAVDAYLESLHPVPSPRLVEGRPNASARRGQRLFESPAVGCARCHPAPRYTDLRRHDVGSRSWRAISTPRRSSRPGGPPRTCTTASTPRSGRC